MSVTGIKRIVRLYDYAMYRPSVQEYYGQSGFFNFGYWLQDTQNQNEACENLMARLLAFVPKTEGAILDVACGTGGSTRRLLDHFAGSDVVGINISLKQLETSRTNVPDCSFIRMDAARLALKDGRFNVAVCVESAFHFDTRDEFLREACRVLKPGGRLVLSDILTARIAVRRSGLLPKANRVNNLESYRNAYLKAGFQEVEVVDATNETWRPFRQRLMRSLWQKFLSREMGVVTFGRVLIRVLVFVTLLSVTIQHYVLVSAKKA